MKKSHFLRYITLSLLLISTIFLLFTLNSCDHKHSFSDVTVIKPATCVETGLQEAVCQCGVIYESEIPVADHVAGEWKVAREATCISTGTTHHICSGCGVTLESAQIPALGHDMVKIEAKAATCYETGYNAHEVCSRCSVSNAIEIQKLPHTKGPAADCSNPQQCTVCKEVLAAPLGHAEVVTPGFPATCLRKGLTDKIDCTICQKTVQEQIEIPTGAHTPVAVTGIEPSCSHKGRTEGSECSECETVLVEWVEIPKTNHLYIDAKDATCEICQNVRILGCQHLETTTIGGVNATCARYGLSVGTACANTKCDWVMESPEIVDLDEHKPALKKGYPATDIKPGLTNEVYCSFCHITLIEQEVIPAGDSTSPDAVNIEIWLAGGQSESVISEHNQEIINRLGNSSFKLTQTVTETTVFDYGGKDAKTSKYVFTFENGNWSTTYKEQNRNVSVTFFDGTLYVKDGNISKRKTSSFTAKDIENLLGLNYTTTMLTAFNKIEIVEEDNGNTLFSCSKLNTETDSRLSNIFENAKTKGNAKLIDSKTNVVIKIDKDNNIQSQNSSISINVTKKFGDDIDDMIYDITTEITEAYEYGQYSVLAPADADTYEEADSFSKLFN